MSYICGQMSKQEAMIVEKTHFEQQLNEEIALYNRQPRLKGFPVDFSKVTSFDEMLEDKMLLIYMIRAGIPFSLFDLIKTATPFTESDWASFLDLSTKSLQRYKSEAGFNFKPIHTEKILEMAEVTKAGLEVFGDMEKLKLWLNTPNYSLGSMKPIELLKDSYGKNMVLDELLRIEHGIFV